MKKVKKEYYKKLDIIRIFACLAILFYHLNILKGGFLAVCIFLCLSGYLLTSSALKNNNFSLLEYYKSRLKKIYLPLLVVVFITVFVSSLMPNLNWLNLKPEVTSVLFGYNNYWQLNANLDYFARHIDSPFMHLWYIAILLQFYLVFPFIHLALKKLGEKCHKLLPTIISGLLAIASMIYFLVVNSQGNIMVTYYSTLTRVFPLFMGMSLAYFINYQKNNINKTLFLKYKDYCFYGYLVVLLILFGFINSKSNFMAVSMILTSIITIRLIMYSLVKDKKRKQKKNDESLRTLANITYEVFLVQYPVIFFFQDINLNIWLKVPIIILLSICLSYLLHKALEIKKDNILRIILTSGIAILTIIGAIQYIIAVDHTKEMAELEDQLAENAKMIEEKQAEYALKLQEEADEWNQVLADYDAGESKIKEMVTNLPVIGIGDSILLGAVPTLYDTFPSGYFDGKVSRTAWAVKEILVDLQNKNMLGNPIVFNLGANGDCNEACKDDIMALLVDKQVYWLTVTNNSSVHFNEKITEFAKKYDNLHIIDWESAAKGHDEYFYADGLHLTVPGRKAFSKAIYDAIYQTYLDEFNAKKEALIKDHEDELKTKINFIGNDIILNAYEDLQQNYPDAKFTINKEYTYETLKTEIEKEISEGTLNYRVVLALDSNLVLTQKEYGEIFKLLKDYEVNVIITNEKTLNELNNGEFENIKLYNFTSEIQDDYYLLDGIHLNKKGNEAFINFIKSNLN